MRTVSFAQRLGETVLWCVPRARADDPKGSLRSESLAPSILSPDRARTVGEVVMLRGNYLRTTAPIVGDLPRHGGRLLVHYPDADLADGAAEIASRGFFDLHNVPPWDTWVAFVIDMASTVSYRARLIAWVPPAMLALAQAGIDANPEQCISWLDDV